MKRMLKNLIIPCIIILIFSVVYFLIIPNVKKSDETKKIFNDFEKGMSNLNIEYEKNSIDASIFGANKAYSYTSNEKTVKLYVYSNNSKEYEQGLIDGYIVSKDDEESKLYGIIVNNCVLYMESGFPNDIEVLNLFQNLSKEYFDSL